MRVTSSSGLEMVLEASEAASLCRSHILQQRKDVYLQQLVTILHNNNNAYSICFCTFIRRPQKCGHLFPWKVCISSTVRLPKFVLAVKHELPNVSRLTSSL